jgi:hypothetical protein
LSNLSSSNLAEPLRATFGFFFLATFSTATS